MWTDSRRWCFQEDVRDWVCELVCDALRFAVLHDDGGEIALATGHEPVEDSTAAVVEGLIAELKNAVPPRARAGGRPGAVTHKGYTLEPVYRILKVASQPEFQGLCLTCDVSISDAGKRCRCHFKLRLASCDS